MSTEYVDLPARIKDSFLNMDADIVVDLRDTDQEYQDIYRRYTKMKEEHPFIDNVLEEPGEVSMTAEEHATFVECMRLRRKLDDMERLHIYFRGHTDAFAYLKTVKAI